MNLATLPLDVRERIIAGAWKEARAQARAQRHVQAPRYHIYGNNANFFACREVAFMLSGPAQTGKTITALCLLDYIARKYPSAQLALLRKVRADMDGTVLQIYRDKVLGKDTDVTVYGGEKAQWFDYPNESRVWVGGMDRPGSALSGERDAIYFNQAEEADLADWETLLTRTTGRAGHLHRETDNSPFGLLFGDCNPGPPTHWIWSQHIGNQLKLFESRHQDNPTLYDQETGLITTEGLSTIAQLDRLTGFRKLRLRDGIWAQAEGIIYDTWSESTGGNVTEEAEYVPNGGGILWAIDDGYSAGSAPSTRGLDPNTGHYVADAHPRVILLVQQKPDGHLDVFYESSGCLLLSDKHIALVKELDYPEPEFAVHGPGSAEIRGRLYAADIAVRQSTANVEESIKEMREQLAADDNHWRRVRVHPRCRHLRAEMTSYAYDPGTNRPVKQFDHHVDALRGLLYILRHER